MSAFNKETIDYTLYVCTDRGLMSCETIEESVELSVKGGATVIQLREKDCGGGEFFELAKRVKKITDLYNVPLIINDRADIALAADCAGVHVGQEDMPCSDLRKIVGNKIIGVSVSSVEEALKAQNEGADYLGVGAMFSTDTKTDADVVTVQTLMDIRKAVDMPIVIIGGINKQTLGNFKGMGIDGIAVISAIVAQPDIKAAAEEIKRLWTE